MEKELLKKLPLSISINLILLKKNKIQSVQINSYELNNNQKKLIIKFINKMKSEIYFKNLNPSNLNIKSKTEKLKNMINNNQIIIISNNKNSFYDNSCNLRNEKNIMYLIKFKLIDENENSEILKEIICDKINNKMMEKLKTYYTEVTKILKKSKVFLTIEYINKNSMEFKKILL